MSTIKKAVVLSSGGIDSTTAMAIARSEGYDIFSLSFDYGQRHKIELEAAKRVAHALGAKRHLVLRIDLNVIGGSALTDNIEVPKYQKKSATQKEIPVTYVPARNTIFLSFAIAWAEVLGASDVYIGVNSIDYSGYPDCRPEYIEAFERMANLATKAAVQGKKSLKIKAPLISLTKAEIIKKGIALGVDYGLTHSCYDPLSNGGPCDHCDSCIIRKRGFAEVGIADPIEQHLI
jgi:7-cyano-7-deazaguanine synthase